MDKKLIEDKLYQIIDQFNGRQITSKKFYSILVNIHVMMEMVQHIRYYLLMKI